MRADLRLTDLRRREKGASKLMNVKIPAHVSDAIQRVARDLGASKTEVVIALLNEGLDVSAESLKGWKPPKPKIQSGYLSRYASLVTSGSTGAILKDRV